MCGLTTDSHLSDRNEVLSLRLGALLVLTALLSSLEDRDASEAEQVEVLSMTDNCERSKANQCVEVEKEEGCWCLLTI
jgi:hypothetical protein